MHLSRLMSAAIAVAVSLSAAPAFAESTSSSASSAKSSSPSVPSLSLKNFCKGKSGDAKSLCVNDANKALARLQYQFREQQDRDREAWYDEYTAMGITDDYRKALAAFVAKQKKDTDVFKAQVLQFRKEVLVEQKKQRGAVKTGNNGFAKRVTSEESAAAKEKCKSEKDNDRERICLRRALQTKDPAAKAWIQRK
jgi:hypothetical protein